jgi:Lar family restriction alleviation protein
MSELKPCPNCGEQSRLATWREMPGPRIEDEYFVRCGNCAKTGPVRNDSDSAKEAWNALPRTDYKALAQRMAAAPKMARALREVRGICNECEFDGTTVCDKCPFEKVRVSVDAALLAAGVEHG